MASSNSSGKKCPVFSDGGRVIKDTLYAKYIKERDQVEILENECGFLLYKIIGKDCLIVDLFIEAESRNLGECRKLVDELSLIAKSANCESLFGNIQINDPGSSRTMKAALAIGFEILSANIQLITIIKKLTGGS